MLHPLRHHGRCGQSAAVRSGVVHARNTCVVTMDGDGQNVPADIPRLVEAWVQLGGGPRMVVGHRVRRRDSQLTRFSSRVANAVRARLLRDATPDTGCGLKVFDRGLFLELPWFDHMHRFLPALAQRAGASVISVPVEHRPRSAGKSKYGVANRLWVGVVDLFGVMWLLRRNQRPEIEKDDNS